MNHTPPSHPPVTASSPRSQVESGLAAEQEAVQAALQRIRQALAAAHEAVHAAVAMTGRPRLPGGRVANVAAAPEPALPAAPEAMAGSDADAVEQAVRAAAQAQEQAQQAAQAQAEAAVAAAEAGHAQAELE